MDILFKFNTIMKRFRVYISMKMEIKKKSFLKFWRSFWKMTGKLGRVLNNYWRKWGQFRILYNKVINKMRIFKTFTDKLWILLTIRRRFKNNLCVIYVIPNFNLSKTKWNLVFWQNFNVKCVVKKNSMELKVSCVLIAVIKKYLNLVKKK